MTRVLGDKFAWPRERVAQAERTMRKLGEMVTPTQALDVVPSDPDDNRIIEAAVAGKCEAIVTGDKDLLRLGSYEGIRIMRVRDFLERGHGKG